MSFAFKLKGIDWQIMLALRRVGSIKNDIVVKDTDEIYNYLEKYSKLDAETVKKEIGFDCEHFNGKSD